MIYEIINPSDACTLVADTRSTACAACMLLGNGAYGLNAASGNAEDGCPPLLFNDPDEWFKTEFGGGLLEYLGKHEEEIVACLRSVAYGFIVEREGFDHAMEAITDEGKRQEYREWWNERNRSSLNNIGRRARDLAEQLQRKRKMVDVEPMGCIVGVA